jgi:nucleotide-binding universal stress UspA family protein
MTKKKSENKKLKVLVPTDFSGHALNAGAFIIELLKNTLRELILENVYQVPKENSGTLISVNDIIISESEAKLKKEQAVLKAKKIKIEVTVQSEEGNPINAVKKAFKKTQANMLVIGHNSKIDKFSSIFISQPEYWPILLVPGNANNKIAKEAIVISTAVAINDGIGVGTEFAEIQKRYKESAHLLYFTKNSTVEHLKATVEALLKKHKKIGMLIFNTTKGDRLEQAIREHQLDSVFFSHPAFLLSNNGE